MNFKNHLRHTLSRITGSFFVLCLFVSAVPAAGAQQDFKRIKNWLVAGVSDTPGGGIPVDENREPPVHADAVLKKHILNPNGEMPEEDMKYNGLSTPWKKSKANQKGEVKDKRLDDGYAYTQINSPRKRVVLAKVQGPYFMYLNGNGYASDLYSRRPVFVPLRLKQGENHLFLKTHKKKFQFQVVKPQKDLFLLGKDLTLPHVRVGHELNSQGGIIVVNNSTEPMQDVTVTTGGGKHFRQKSRTISSIPPVSYRKVAVPIELSQPLKNKPEEKIPLKIKISKDFASFSRTVKLTVRKKNQAYKETFLSPIDGSVQYNMVVPPKNPVKEGEKAGLLLAMHGAGVKVDSWKYGGTMGYTPKEDMYIVIATNRRPFGFSWEDRGRENAMHILKRSLDKFPIDPNRVYAGGHSMGGHGSWQLGTIFPGTFAGISPSAGWVGYFGFDGVPGSSNDYPFEFTRRVWGQTDTISLVKNLKELAVFIIHGGEDDVVPVSHAQHMNSELNKFHDNFRYHEEPGAGHWWDKKDTPGQDCVDMKEVFKLFQKHPRDPKPEHLEFRTWNPGISAEHRWVRVNLQETLLDKSKITADAQPGEKSISITTSNVSSLTIDPSTHFDEGKLSVSINGKETSVRWEEDTKLHFRLRDGTWTFVDQPVPDGWKNPKRYGPFKRSFRKNFVVVYGTGGSEEMKNATRGRARFDAQVWWYRGNGGAEVIPDKQFSQTEYKNRNVILYGNADNNSAFKSVIGDSPITVKNERLVVGEKTFLGADISTFYVRPRKGSKKHLVGVVGGTGPYGIRATMVEHVFNVPDGHPDFYVWRRTKSGSGEEFEVLGAGIFGPDWSMDTGDTWFK